MATLKLKEFRCVEESDEVGSDSPYFVIFVGDPSQPGSEAKLHLVRRESWDNETDTGELKTPNAVVSKDVGTGDLVLCALMEEDDNRDVAGQAFERVENWMQTVFDAYRASGSASAKQMAGKLKPEFRRALNTALCNDEILDIVHVPVTTDNGRLEARNFYGDGGHYRVRFVTHP